MIFDSLPQGWAITKLEDLVSILDSMREPVNNSERQNRIEGKPNSELFPYYGATGEVGKIDNYLFDEELVALGEDGVPFLDAKKSKAYMLRGKTWVNNHAHVLKAIDGITTNSFILNFLNQFDYLGYVNGGTRLKLTQANMRNIPVPLPPLTEQQQIAAKLDELLAQVDTLKIRLDTIPKILKRFRQSVLAAAVSGKLTEDWRGTKPVGIVVTIGEVASDIRYGTSKKCDYETGNTPVIRIPNIDNGFLNLTDLKFADFDDKELKNLSLVVGDLLLIRSNGSVDLVGKTALITEKDVHCLYAGYLIRIRLNQQMVMPKYLLYCLQSLQIRKVIEIQARSTSGVNNINSKELAALKFLLPHLEEQTEIVARVEQLFTYADQIEQRVKDAQTRVNHLTQSILAKAFRGELTADWREQNPDLISGENSAEALLARIKAERQLLGQNKVTKRRIIKKSGENMKPKGILPIIEALKAAGQPLSSQDLLVQSGYPSDAGTEQLEAFFLDIREQLNAKAITRNRQGDQEFFSIVE